MSHLRLTGLVGRVDVKPFVYKSGTRQGQAGEFRTARVIAGDCDFVDVQLGDKLKTPARGEAVDWSVKVKHKPARDNFPAGVEFEAVDHYVDTSTGQIGATTPGAAAGLDAATQNLRSITKTA